MATTIPSTALVPVVPVFTGTERLALAGFLAGYSGLTQARNLYRCCLCRRSCPVTRPPHGIASAWPSARRTQTSPIVTSKRSRAADLRGQSVDGGGVSREHHHA